MRHLVGHLSGVPDRTRQHLTNSLQARQLIDLLKALVNTGSLDTTVKDKILHGCQVAEKCRRNRNVFGHSWINIFGDKLYKAKSGHAKPGIEWHDFELQAARDVADDCWRLGHYFMQLSQYFGALGNPHRRVQLPDSLDEPRVIEVEGFVTACEPAD